MTATPTPSAPEGGPSKAMHSTLPWHHCNCGHCGNIWSSADDWCVAEVQQESEIGCVPEAIRQANAKFIVEACNAYGARPAPLSEPSELEEAAKGMADALQWIGNEAWPISDPLNVLGGTLKVQRDRIEQIRLKVNAALQRFAALKGMAK